MIKRLQRKFVVIAAVCLLIVEFTIIGGINGVNIYQTNKNADDLLNIIIENDGRFPEFDPKGMKHDKPQDNSDSASPPESKKPDKHRGFNEETKYQTRYFVVYADSNGEITKVDTGHVAAVSSSQAIEYGKSVLDSGKTAGTSGNYRYKTGDTDKGKIIVFMDCRSDSATKNRFLLVSCAIGAAGYILVCLLIIIFSKRAIRPVVESFEKQKQFITDASHELKTPITVIATSLKVLEMEVGQQKWIDKAQTQTEKLTELVNSLVTLSRMDEEDSPLKMEPFPVSDAVSETAESFRDLALSRGHPLELTVQPELTYRGDEYAVRQLTSILLDNAVKYAAPESPITLTLEKGRKGVVLRQSNRCAEPESIDPAKLFDRFYQADPSRGAGGFGIGLSIARSIVEGHRGTIRAAVSGDTITFTAELK